MVAAVLELLAGIAAHRDGLARDAPAIGLVEMQRLAVSVTSTYWGSLGSSSSVYEHDTTSPVILSNSATISLSFCTG